VLRIAGMGRGRPLAKSISISGDASRSIERAALTYTAESAEGPYCIRSVSRREDVARSHVEPQILPPCSRRQGVAWRCRAHVELSAADGHP